MKSLDFALLLSKYLTQYLPAQRNLSSNTICSYRDTFKLLLIFCRDIQGFNIAKLPMTQLDRKCIEDFILWLRNIRKSSPSTCNQRLCAIHAFFDYVMVEEPQFMEQCIQIHNIPKMVSSAPPAKYLTPDALRCLLATPDITTPKGRRHLVLLTVLYDTAARVSELADIRMRDVRLDSPAAIHRNNRRFSYSNPRRSPRRTSLLPRRTELYAGCQSGRVRRQDRAVRGGSADQVRHKNRLPDGTGR